jgi:hypothetical protein
MGLLTASVCSNARLSAISGDSQGLSILPQPPPFPQKLQNFPIF